MIKKMEVVDTTVEVENEDVTLAPEDAHGNIKVVTVEGQEQFECALCGKVYKHKRTAESHVIKIHKKLKDKPIAEQVEHGEASKEDDDDDGEFDMDRLNIYEKSTPEEGGDIGDATLAALFGSQPVSQDIATEDVDENEVEKEESVETLKQELLEVKTKLKSMEEEYAVMEANAKDDKATKESLEQALVTNKQLLDISEAKASSLAIELEVKNTKIKRFEDVFKTMDVTLKVLKEAAKKNVDPLTDKENKDLKEEVKSKKKEIEEANRKANDAMKKLKLETNARSVAQAEIVRITKFLETQASMIKRLERLDENKTGEKRRRSRSDERREEKRRRRSRSPDRRGRVEKSPERSTRSNELNSRKESSKERRKSKEQGVCWAISRPGGCSYGLRCKYSHPSQGARSKSKDRVERSHSQVRSKGRSSSQERRSGRGSSPGRRRSNYSQEGRSRRSRSREKEQAKEECRYWLQDTCSFGAKCRGLHDASRRGIRRKEELRSNETRSSQEPRSNQDRRRGSSNQEQVFFESLASQVSQGIARGCEALLPKLAPAPLPQLAPAPLLQLTQAPLPQLAPAPQPSFASSQMWRAQQPLVAALWNGGASAGPDRLSGWQ